jgi:hypothetical protein
MKMKTTDKNFDVEMTDPNEAFKNAIDKHLLSTVWGREDYAGNYMYMYSDKGKDFFKSIETRAYISCEGV